MGGIAAILGYEHDQSIVLITKMCQALRNRGLNYRTFSDFNITLGNVDSYANSSNVSNQTLYNKKENVWIAFDGHLSNKKELKSKENVDDLLLTSDAETVLDDYATYGESFINHLEGSFAFCLWDLQKLKLICGRDQFGVKPLYYFGQNGKYVFSSEIKAFFADPNIPKIPNHDLIRNFLLKGYHYRNGETFFDGIKEVLPGHYLCFDIKKNEMYDQEYWHVPKEPTCQAKNVNYSSELLVLFQQSIQEMLPKNGIFATSMAGGLDSQAIASVIDNMVKSSDNIKHIKISAVFRTNKEEDNEEPYVKEYARFQRTKVEYVYLPNSLTWDDAKDFVYNAQEPLTLNCYIYWSISKELNKKRVKVAFLGLGADPLLWGRDYDVDHYIDSLWQKKKIGPLITELFYKYVPKNISLELFEKVSDVVRNKLIPTSKLFDVSQFFDERYLSKETGKLNKSLIDPMRSEILAYVQEADRLFWANSVETKNPFLNKALADFIILLPPNQKVRRGVKKFVLRKAMKNIVPDAVVKTKRKFPTPVPIVEWLTGLYPEITQMLSSQKFKDRQIFNVTKIFETYKLLCEGKLNSTEVERFTVVLWRIINLELWFESYID